MTGELASYAQQKNQTRGREHIEEQSNIYSEWSIDITKILSSRAWDLLRAKSVWDHPRVGISWMYVATTAAFFAKQVARALRCNEELSEACTLVLNLGRAPCAYEGSRGLSWILQPHGGYDPYAQALRVVEKLEVIHSDYNGLNLSWETREILFFASKKHSNFINPVVGFSATQPSLEASIAMQCVRITLVLTAIVHALNNGILTAENFRSFAVWQAIEEPLFKQYKRLEERRRVAVVIGHLRDILLEDLIQNSLQQLKSNQPSSSDAVRRSNKKFITHSPQMHNTISELEDLLNASLNHNEQRLTGRQRRLACIHSLWELLQRNTTLLDPNAQLRLRKEPPPIVVCDFICSLTDAEFSNLIQQFFIENEPLTPIQQSFFIK